MATSCANYGSLNGSTCDCPTGFGGGNCSQPACGGNIFQGSGRPLADWTLGSLPNITGCACADGWTGTGCNVCQTASVCQSAYSGAGYSPGSSGLADGTNETLVCNADARVYAAGQMSCAVNNPTLQALFPLSSNLNILRTLNPSLTPVPNITGFGPAGSVYAQLFYAGVEQFYCSASSCTQTLDNSTGAADWTCASLACACVANTTFCSGAESLSSIVGGLSGQLVISCDAPSGGSASCAFKQDTIDSVFGSGGLTLTGCTFGECVAQDVIDDVTNNSTGSSGTARGGKPLGGGVIAGLAVVGGLILLALLVLAYGFWAQRRARRAGPKSAGQSGGVAVEWSDMSYFVPQAESGWSGMLRRRGRRDLSDQKVILDNVGGRVQPGEIMAVMGPSGAGKTTMIEILAGKHKSGRTTGLVSFPSSHGPVHAPRIGFVPQQDVLPPMLTVSEALLFAARLRLPESIPDTEKRARVDALVAQLGLAHIRDTRIGDGERRGISGGEMRRVSIGLELVARPDVLILDEPTSGLDSVSAKKVGEVLRGLAHDNENPTAVIASIHQPSSQLFQCFDKIILLSHGRALYYGAGGLAPADYFASRGIPYSTGYNVADYLLDVASDPPVGLFQSVGSTGNRDGSEEGKGSNGNGNGADSVDVEKAASSSVPVLTLGANGQTSRRKRRVGGGTCATTFLTQLEVLSGREWVILRRDKTLFLTHIAVSCVLGVFVGGLYYKIGVTIAGFQSRVGCLFFLGALIAFSSLSALYNIVEIRPLFLRERSAGYYSPTAWLLSRFVFDVVPLRVIPTIIVSSITYWMVGLAHDAAHFFKFLFILVLYTLVMTLFNFLLACLFRNGGIAILLSALLALYQMTYAGFFVHLGSIPPVLRWLQWLCPLKYNLEALSVNEVGSGLMIKDSLDGVPVDVSASLIMETLFGFGADNYYRDVLVLFAFIAGFGLMVIGTVWVKVRERR
ncbi:ABC transporter [Rhodofomes roseus]|uniref:ABC transporter n=1 Tax=Rhodofomes roseus TaxID=34475 RepID=A0ABQ8KU26_9APHY|nr:ABC transporter [Rhodofomes roseus]KAH9842509.1 ABC transporter [Rhodofomes roseus]